MHSAKTRRREDLESVEKMASKEFGAMGKVHSASGLPSRTATSTNIMPKQMMLKPAAMTSHVHNDSHVEEWWRDWS